MSSPGIPDPFFVAVTAPAFTRDRIADLAAGRCAAVRVPGLLPRAWCDEVLRALTEVAFDTYGHERVDPPVMRFGVGVSDHRRDGRVTDGYWRALDAGRAAWKGLRLPFDPFRECRSALGAHWHHPVEVGRRGGREMGAGVAREPNQGFQPHYDDALREFTGDLLDDTLVAQFAFNLYLSVPDHGGETVVWRRRWHPDDEGFRLPHSYGFAPGVVGDAQSFDLVPAVGEALLFDPRNYHAVRPSVGSRRISLGFSMGLTTEGKLLTWG